MTTGVATGFIACDHRAFSVLIAERARKQAGVIRGMAEAGDRAAVALLPIAGILEQSLEPSDTLYLTQLRRPSSRL